MRRLTMLVADDDHWFREALSEYLEERPDVELVGSSRDASDCLDLARRVSPDLVLLDVCMPGTDGLEAARRLKQERPGVKVMMCSVWATEEAKELARLVGADAYFVKGRPLSALIDEAFALCGNPGDSEGLEAAAGG